MQVTGIMHIVAGALCVVLGIAAVILKAYISYLAMPIWGGLLVSQQWYSVNNENKKYTYLFRSDFITFTIGSICHTVYVVVFYMIHAVKWSKYNLNFTNQWKFPSMKRAIVNNWQKFLVLQHAWSRIFVFLQICAHYSCVFFLYLL